jgi:YD repeat-containing protein
MSSRSGLVAVAVALMMASGCAGSPSRGRPIPAGKIESGPNSLESVRRVFEGSWDLVSAESYNATGQPVAIKGKGRLTYDAYGNMTVDARLDEGQENRDGAISRLLSYKGRAVIDVAASRLVLQDLQKRDASGADVPEAMAAANVRYYSFDGDLLTLTIKDAAGKTTAKTVWRRISASSPAATSGAFRTDPAAPGARALVRDAT